MKEEVKEEKVLIELTEEQLDIIRNDITEDLNDELQLMFDTTRKEHVDFEAEALMAQEYVDLIDAIQRRFGYMTFQTWQRYALAMSEDWSEYRLPENFDEMTEEEINAKIAAIYYDGVSVCERDQNKLIQAGFHLLRRRDLDIWHRDDPKKVWRRLSGPYKSKYAVDKAMKELLADMKTLEV